MRDLSVVSGGSKGVEGVHVIGSLFFRSCDSHEEKIPWWPPVASNLIGMASNPTGDGRVDRGH